MSERQASHSVGFGHFTPLYEYQQLERVKRSRCRRGGKRKSAWIRRHCGEMEMAKLLMFAVVLVAQLLSSTEGQGTSNRCSFPPTVDFEDCLYDDKHAASSGYEWQQKGSGARTAWRRYQGSTLRPSGIPDHTRQQYEGNFMATIRTQGNATSSAVEEDLLSPVFTAPTSGSVCRLFFWVRFVSPAANDRLKVKLSLKEADGTSTVIQLDALGPSLQGAWQQKSVFIGGAFSGGQKDFQIVFRSSMKPFPTTNKSLNYIAIDDISFSTDCCAECNYAPRLDMECGLQGYNVLPSPTDTKATQWLLHSGSPASDFTGPSADNTFQGPRGHYLYLDSFRNPLKTANLESPLYKKPVPGMCNISFAYHMKGAGIGTLSLLMRTPFSNSETTLWTLSGEQGGDWLNTVVPLDSSYDYQIIFRGTSTADARGDIALDDVVFSEGCCVGSAGSIPALKACGDVGYDTRVERNGEDRTNIVFIDTALRFECNGTVDAWKLRTTDACTYKMSIWRLADPMKKDYYRMEQETIVAPKAGNNFIKSSATAPLHFDAGDIIGWEYVSGPGRIRRSQKIGESVHFVELKNLRSSSVLVNNVIAYRFDGRGTAVVSSISAIVLQDGETRPTTPSVIKVSNATVPMATSTGPRSNDASDHVPMTSASASLRPTTRVPVSTTVIAGSQIDTSEPIYPWVIMGLILLGIILVMIIVLAYYVKNHWNAPPKHRSPGHKRPVNGVTGRFVGRKESASSFHGSMKLPVINGSPLHQAGSSGYGKKYPATTPAMLEISRPTLACETRLPSPGFMAVPTPSVMKAFPGMVIQQPAPSFNMVPEYTDPMPEIEDSLATTTTTQESSLQDSHNQDMLSTGGHHSRQSSGLTDGGSLQMVEESCSPTHDDASSGSINETPSRKSETTTESFFMRPGSPSKKSESTMDSFLMRSRCQSEHLRTMSSASASRPQSRSDAFVQRNIASPFRNQRRTPYAEPFDIAMGKASRAYPRYSSPYQEPAVTVPGIFAQLKSGTYKCLQRDKIDVQAMIAHGHMCAVYAGVWKKGTADVPVAVKTVYPKKEGDYMPFLREATIMGQFSHRNIVQLFGVVMDETGKAPQLILELMSDNLKNYLESLRPSGEKLPEIASEHLGEQQLNMCHDIASGMAYLESKGFVHRDLAAQNIMIGSDRVCKVGDFSMCRDMGAPDSLAQSKNANLPVRWVAPEVFKYHKFSAASDVWSYGVLLYEIWGLGAKPYDDLEADDVHEHVESGHRLPPPSKCPLAMYEIMVDCWHPYSMDRPQFCHLVQILEMTDRNILLGQIQPPTDPCLYDESEELKAETSGAAETPYEKLQNRYKNSSSGELSSKFVFGDEKRFATHVHVRQSSVVSGTSKLTSLPRHMLAEQMSNHSSVSIDTGSSSVTSV